MNRFTAFVDVDGTMIDREGRARPYLCDFLDGLDAFGGAIVVWSAGGVDYAQHRLTQIERQVGRRYNDVAVIPKGMRKDASYGGPKVFVDDHEGLIVAKEQDGHFGVLVPYYDGGAEDTALVLALRDITYWVEGGCPAYA
jgi:hypothetical protein